MRGDWGFPKDLPVGGGEQESGLNALDLIHLHGSPLTALLYAPLFWPDFVVLEGMIFLEGRVEDESDRQDVLMTLRRLGGDSRETQRRYNFLTIEDLFGRHRGESSTRQDMGLLEILRQMWAARLKALFPDRSFQVSVEQVGDDMGIVFWDEGSADR